MTPTHSLVYLCNDTHICLGYKKRGFGAGNWNGFGGKIKAEETPAASAVRELEEETSLQVEEESLKRVANLTFIFVDGSEVRVAVFITNVWSGEPIESEEMRPEWFLYKDIPYQEMWATDAAWLPLVLAGKQITGGAHFESDGATVLKQTYKEI